VRFSCIFFCHSTSRINVMCCKFFIKIPTNFSVKIAKFTSFCPNILELLEVFKFCWNPFSKFFYLLFFSFLIQVRKFFLHSRYSIFMFLYKFILSISKVSKQIFCIFFWFLVGFLLFNYFSSHFGCRFVAVLDLDACFFLSFSFILRYIIRFFWKLRFVTHRTLFLNISDAITNLWGFCVFFKFWGVNQLRNFRL